MWFRNEAFSWAMFPCMLLEHGSLTLLNLPALLEFLGEGSGCLHKIVAVVLEKSKKDYHGYAIRHSVTKAGRWQLVSAKSVPLGLF